MSGIEIAAAAAVFSSVIGGASAVSQASHRSAIARRQHGIAKVNAEIAERNRVALLESYGQQAEQIGDQAGGIIADNQVRRGASGFSIDSGAFNIQRNANRTRLERNLEIIGQQYAAQDSSLVNQAFGHNSQAALLAGQAEFESSQIPLIALGTLASATSSAFSALGTPSEVFGSG